MNPLFRSGELAPFWRFLLSVPLVLLASLLAGFVVGGLPPRVAGLGQEMTSLLWYNLLLLASLLILYKILLKVVDRKPLAAVGFGFHERWVTELGLGLGFGAGMLLAVAIIERLAGVASFEWNGGESFRAALTLTPLLVVAAATEELFFRGYPFQRLVDSMGAIGAVAFSSAFFGFAHLLNPFHSTVSTLNTVLIGILLAISYLRTRTLWMPLGIHFAWNYMEGYVLGYPVSGIVIPQTLARTRVHGAAWLAGGAYGPEGGIVTTAVILAGLVYVTFSRRLRVSTTMRLITSPTAGQPGDESAAGVFFDTPLDSEKR